MPAPLASRASSSRARCPPRVRSLPGRVRRRTGVRRPGFTRIERGELVERVMEIEHVNVALRALSGIVGEGDASPAPGPLRHLMGARPIHQDAPHHLGRHRQELRAVLPDRAILIHQTKVDLVHEGRRLQRLTRAFAPEERGRSTTKLSVHSRDQPIPRLEVALVPCLEKGGDIDGPVIAGWRSRWSMQTLNTNGMLTVLTAAFVAAACSEMKSPTKPARPRSRRNNHRRLRTRQHWPLCARRLRRFTTSTRQLRRGMRLRRRPLRGNRRGRHGDPQRECSLDAVPGAHPGTA